MNRYVLFVMSIACFRVISFPIRLQVLDGGIRVIMYSELHSSESQASLNEGVNNYERAFKQTGQDRSSILIECLPSYTAPIIEAANKYFFTEPLHEQHADRLLYALGQRWCGQEGGRCIDDRRLWITATELTETYMGGYFTVRARGGGRNTSTKFNLTVAQVYDVWNDVIGSMKSGLVQLKAKISDPGVQDLITQYGAIVKVLSDYYEAGVVAYAQDMQKDWCSFVFEICDRVFDEWYMPGMTFETFRQHVIKVAPDLHALLYLFSENESTSRTCMGFKGLAEIIGSSQPTVHVLLGGIHAEFVSDMLISAGFKVAYDSLITLDNGKKVKNLNEFRFAVRQAAVSGDDSLDCKPLAPEVFRHAVARPQGAQARR